MKDLEANSAAANGAGATPGQPENKADAAPELRPDARPDAPQIGARYRLLSVADLDQRTAAYRSTKQLISDIESDLGGPDQLSAAERQLAQHSAVLGAILADMEVNYLKHRRIDPVLFCTVVNAQRRTLEAIGLRRRPRDVTPDLQTYLAAKPEADRG
jgi:hypothetical protein